MGETLEFFCCVYFKQTFVLQDLKEQNKLGGKIFNSKFQFKAIQTFCVIGHHITVEIFVAKLYGKFQKMRHSC